MAYERRNPLPIGWYWVDVPNDKDEAFGQWIEHNGITVKETKEHRDEGLLIDSDVKAISYLFYVPKETPWEGPGFPTIASQETKLDDTVQRPDPEPDFTDQLADAIPTPRGIMWIGGAILAIGLGVMLSRRR